MLPVLRGNAEKSFRVYVASKIEEAAVSWDSDRGRQDQTLPPCFHLWFLGNGVPTPQAGWAIFLLSLFYYLHCHWLCSGPHCCSPALLGNPPSRPAALPLPSITVTVTCLWPSSCKHDSWASSSNITWELVRNARAIFSVSEDPV